MEHRQGKFLPHYEAYADHQKEIHTLIDQLPVPSGSEAFESEGDQQIPQMGPSHLNRPGQGMFPLYSGSNVTMSQSDMSGEQQYLQAFPQRQTPQQFFPDHDENREQESRKARRGTGGFLQFRSQKQDMRQSRLSMGADDSDCSGSLTPGQMLKWSRRHIVQEGASIFPKVQAPSVDLTMNDGISKKGAGGGGHFNNSSDTLSPLATLRVPHSLLSQQFGSSHISPREGSMGGEIEQHFVGALRRAQESLDSHDEMKRAESPLSLTPSPSSESKSQLLLASKWLFSPSLKNPGEGEGEANYPSVPHLQSIQQSERQRLPSSEGPMVRQSGQSHIPPTHFQSCDTLGPMLSFGEDPIHSNEGSKLGGQALPNVQKRPGSAYSRSTSKDGANVLLPPTNSSAFP